MEASTHLSDILSEAKKLTKEEQLTLIQRLVVLIKKSEVALNSGSRLTALSGLGSELWKNTSAIDEYLEEERQW